MSRQHRSKLQGFIKFGVVIGLALSAAGCGRIPFVPVYNGNPNGFFEHYGSGRTAAAHGPREVTVRRGDTLSEIALRNGVPTRELAQANGLRAPFTIYVGQELTVPGSPTHTVRRGESLSQIAAVYDVDARELARTNNIRRPDRIYAGQEIVLPWSSRTSASPAPARTTYASNTTTDNSPVTTTRTASRNTVERAAPTPRRVTPVAASAVSARDLTPPARSGRGFMWPVSGPIISDFGPKAEGQHNDGVNIAVPEGTPVRAADAGVVIYSGNEVPGYGNLVLIRHENGYVTAYAHNSRLNVSQGHVVDRGEIIALSGRTGRVTEPQVHFEVRRNSEAVNPAQFLAGA